MPTSWLLFFDGDCAFCSRSVRQVFRFDKRKRIFYTPLQGRLSRERGYADLAAEKGGTMVVIRESDGKAFTRSDAWIEVAIALGGWWNIFRIAKLIPKFLRDFVYNLVGNNRYRLIGKNASCALPEPELMQRIRE